jgi:hypothetical protein
VSGLGSFAKAERDLLVRLPRWIVGAASAVQPDNAARTHRELEAGFLAVANGRLAKDPFLTEVANGTLDIFDEEGPIDTAGVDTVLEKAGEAWQFAAGQVTPTVAAAYARWLLDITDEVISAARSMVCWASAGCWSPGRATLPRPPRASTGVALTPNPRCLERTIMYFDR